LFHLAYTFNPDKLPCKMNSKPKLRNNVSRFISVLNLMCSVQLVKDMYSMTSILIYLQRSISYTDSVYV